MSKRITLEGFNQAVALLGCEPASLRAVLAVESRNSGFDKKGRVLILFEPHVFHQQLLAEGSSLQLKAALARGLAYPTWGEKPYPTDSYPSLLAATAIQPELAHRSASWGIGQLLGRNFKLCGYSSALAMASDFSVGEDTQIIAIARFIKANPTMHRALVEKDWAAFALRYNGKGYRKNRYDEKLASAYAQFLNNPLKDLQEVVAGKTQSDISRTNADIVRGTVVVATTTVTTTAVVPEKVGATLSEVLVVGGIALALILIASLVITHFSRLTEREPQLG